jgi:hypothetical protein
MRFDRLNTKVHREIISNDLTNPVTSVQTNPVTSVQTNQAVSLINYQTIQFPYYII